MSWSHRHDAGVRAKKKPACRLRSRSDLVIEALLEARPNARKSGFSTEVARRWDCPDLHAIARAVIPDAFEFHDDLEAITLIEVVDTNPIRAAKACRIATLSYALDDLEWALEVAVYDPCGALIDVVNGWCFDEIFSSRHAKGVPGEDVLPAARAAMRYHAANGGKPISLDDVKNWLEGP